MIPFYLVQAVGGKVLTIDDRAVVKDLAALAGTGGNSYTPTLVIGPQKLTSGWSRMRRLVQRVPHDGAVTVTLTPIRDGQESGNVITRALDSTDVPTVTLPMAETGTEFQAQIELSAFDADCGLGEAELWVIPRRSIR